MAVPMIAIRAAAVILPFLKKHPYFLPTLIVAAVMPIFFTVMTVIGIISGLSGIQTGQTPASCTQTNNLGNIFDSWNNGLSVGSGLEGNVVGCEGDGTWVSPIQPMVRISDWWGDRFDPYICSFSRTGQIPCPHHGLDIGAAKDTPIHAVSNGIVRQAGNNGTCGNSVVIEHPGKIWTLYCHMGWKSDGVPNIDVKAGDSVASGQVIGGVGNTGLSVGADGGYHLHFQIFVGEYVWKMGTNIVDPLLFMAQQGVDLSVAGTEPGVSQARKAAYCVPNTYHFSWCE